MNRRRRSERRERGRVAGVALAITLALLCVGWAVLNASSVASHDAQSSRAALQQSSTQIASAITLAIQREQDLSVAAGGFLQGSGTSDHQFVAWTQSIRLLERYPELFGLGALAIVPRTQLAGFTARARAAGLLASSHGALQILPPGIRPYYCLTVVGIIRSESQLPPAGLDYCAAPYSVPILAARDSGVGTYEAASLSGQQLLVTRTPTYRGGVPTTVAARRQRYVGSVAMAASATQLLANALRGHPGMAVAFRFARGATDIVFQNGHRGTGESSATVDLHNNWTVQTFAPVASGSIFASSTAVELLGAGSLGGLLLAGLILTLADGRRRALRLVELRTRELRHQALHDGLTGIPNRTLIMDRLEQLLARSARSGSEPAVMFIDLDDFKGVNDTLGHETGDQLLIAVADRMTDALRKADTIGRLGGDEFVVLLDSDSAGPWAPVAERLLSVLREPFELDGTPVTLNVTASVGIAVGAHTNPSGLLREADLALYRAKGAGRDRYELFCPEEQAETSQAPPIFEIRGGPSGISSQSA